MKKKQNQIKFIDQAIALFLLTAVLVSACAAVPSAAAVEPTLTSAPVAEASDTPAVAAPTQTATTEAAEVLPEAQSPTETPEPSPTPDMRLDPGDWRAWPVIPTVSARALEIYQQGIRMGNDPARFSKIGDCQNVNSYFLADFDKPKRYALGEDYDYLQEVIDHYAGSYSRESQSVRGGFNVATVLNPMFADPEVCEKNESPIACELRINNPSVVIISMETWWNHDDPYKYEFYMRKILDLVIEEGVLPIIATKADNLEGEHVINRSIAQLAYEYDIPMWNFWAAADVLPDHGLTDDGFHLTLGLGNYFDNPDNFVGAWPTRNLTALQSLNAVYQAVKEIE
ncbi:MAG: hypothetical protein JW750_08180 [Anaerolineaceae bacterium]|nr:hypothetical protein [Anaerolineaceae bacterium]